MAEFKKTLSVRLKPELKKWINERAERNVRSLNAEINFLLLLIRKELEKKKDV